ncbi:hypothetical protein BC827DRAFT_1247959 [Russula dissimulans]|nr:hypothetical protein BC827DRAFT_1247959 [Russula dissimulans]
MWKSVGSSLGSAHITLRTTRIRCCLLFEKAEAERRREPRDIGVGGSHWSPLTTIYLFLDVDVIDVRQARMQTHLAFRSHSTPCTLKTCRDPKTYPSPEAPSDSLLCRCQRCCPAQPRCISIDPLLDSPYYSPPARRLQQPAATLQFPTSADALAPIADHPHTAALPVLTTRLSPQNSTMCLDCYWPLLWIIDVYINPPKGLM